jgi:hypothetical protein
MYLEFDDDKNLESIDCFGLDTTEQYGYLIKSEHNYVIREMLEAYWYNDLMYCDRYYPIDDAERDQIKEWLKYLPM